MENKETKDIILKSFKPRHKKNMIIFFSCLIALDLAYFFAFIFPHIQSLDLTAKIYHIVFYAVLNIPAIILYIVNYVKSNIAFTDTEIILSKVVGKVRLPYSDILYIDEDSVANDKLGYIFIYTAKAVTLTLPKDKNNKVSEELKKHCKDLLTKEEMIEKGFLE